MKVETTKDVRWRIEDQEWWQKYSAMVRAKEIQVEKADPYRIAAQGSGVSAGMISSGSSSQGSNGIGLGYGLGLI